MGKSILFNRIKVKNEADYVTVNPGGSGAIREVIEYILKKSGKWDQLMDRYQEYTDHD